MRKSIIYSLMFICMALISCTKTEQLLTTSPDSSKQVATFEEVLLAVDSLNLAYGIDEMNYVETKGIGEKIGSHYADQFGAKLGSNIGKRIGSSLGVITANPVVGVVGYLGGRYIGGVAGSIAASWIAGAIITGGIAALLDAPSQIDENTTVGEIHNIILNRLHTNGETYITTDGIVLFDKLYDDILEIQMELGIEDDLSKDLTYRLEMKSFCADVYENTQLSLSNNESQEAYLDRLSNSLTKFDIPEEDIRDFRELNDKLVIASSQLNEDQALAYAEDFEIAVDATSLPVAEKSEIKTVGSISIQSTQYWK